MTKDEEIKQLETRHAKLKSKPWLPWRAEPWGKYWIWNGSTLECTERNDCLNDQYYNKGNYHQTKEQAHAYGMRQRSVIPTCPMPQIGERCWLITMDGTALETCFSSLLIPWYHAGRIKLTKMDADAWSAGYQKYWKEV